MPPRVMRTGACAICATLDESATDTSGKGQIRRLEDPFKVHRMDAVDIRDGKRWEREYNPDRVSFHGGLGKGESFVGV